MNRFALIGCGRIAEKHVEALAAIPEAELAAVSDPVAERMDRIEELYREARPGAGRIAKAGDYRALLAKPVRRFDTAVITTISGLHASIARDVLLADCHVVIEKPIALSLEDAAEIARLSDERGKRAMVCHQLRHRPIMRRIKSLIAEGALGRMLLGSVSLRIHRGEAYYKAASWRGTWALDGGMLVNQGIHMVDLLTWFLGDATTVYGVIQEGNAEVKETEDAAAGLIAFASGASGIVEANAVSYPNNIGYALSLFGECGTIVLEGPALDRIVRFEVKGRRFDAEQLTREMDDSGDRLHMYREFILALREPEKASITDAREGTKAMEAIAGLYLSSRTGAPVRLPVGRFDTSFMRG